MRMSDTNVTELDRLDGAFAGNLLLATFSAEARGLLEPYGEVIELAVGERVQTRGQDVEWRYFPFGTTMISLVVEIGRRAIGPGCLDRPGRRSRRHR